MFTSPIRYRPPFKRSSLLHQAVNYNPKSLIVSSLRGKIFDEIFWETAFFLLIKGPPRLLEQKTRDPSTGHDR